MRIACIGGGPAGLTFALLMKKLDPGHHITVVERNRPYDTFGWGVVFSDATMVHLRRWDEETAGAIEAAFAHWDDIVLEFKGRAIRSGGHGFVGIGRKRLLNILQARCEALGVKLVFETDVDSDEDYPDADLLAARLQDVEQPLATDADEAVSTRADRAPLELEDDVVPMGEGRLDRAGRLLVPAAQVRHGGVGEDHAPAERVVRVVALDHRDVVARVELLHQEGEREAGGAAADADDAHGVLVYAGKSLPGARPAKILEV